MEATATPGTRLGASPLKPGQGAYAVPNKEGVVEIYASVVGRVVVQDGVVAVIGQRSETLPEVGAVVTGRVLRVTPKLADVQILCVGNMPLLGSGFKGTLRKDNVRAYQSDQASLRFTRCARACYVAGRVGLTADAGGHGCVVSPRRLDSRRSGRAGRGALVRVVNGARRAGRRARAQRGNRRASGAHGLDDHGASQHWAGRDEKSRADGGVKCSRLCM